MSSSDQTRKEVHNAQVTRVRIGRWFTKVCDDRSSLWLGSPPGAPGGPCGVVIDDVGPGA